MINPYERAPGRKEGVAEMMTCPRCGGRGHMDGKRCERCQGRGKVTNRS